MTDPSDQAPTRRKVRAPQPTNPFAPVDPAVPDTAVYERAFQKALPGLADKWRRLLEAHVKAPGHAMTPHELADVVGYRGHPPVNSAYGQIGRRVADATGYRPKRLSLQGEECKTFAFADWDKDRGAWVLYPSVAKALAAYGLDR